MSDLDMVNHTLDLSQMIVKSYVNDLSDSDLLIRAVPGMNHIAWQLGHLIATEYNAMELLKPGVSPKLSAEFLKAHDREDTSSNDPSHFLTKDGYLKTLDDQRAATKQIMSELTIEELASAAPEQWQRMCPTVAHVLNMVAGHYLMHVGQWVAVRRTLNKPVAI